MLIWILFALLTVLAALAVLLPLARGPVQVPPEAEHDLAVYRDQLAELDRDRERGLIGGAEAEAARTEIARRLIRAGEAAGAGGVAGRSWARPVALAAMLFIPLTTLGIYLTLGNPALPDQPLAARLEGDDGQQDVAAMIARVENHLAAHPDDATGWSVVAPIYMRLGRYGDAAEAWRRVIALGNGGPDLQEAYGEALVAANDGIVSAPAQSAFEAAIADDPQRIKARFYQALGLKQAGRNEDALEAYEAIIARSPADAPWLPEVRASRSALLALVGRPADSPEPPTLPAQTPGPDAEAVASAATMSADERQAMIEGMVNGLAERLAAEPRDAEGWQRLIRAYSVLGRTNDAKAAYAKARETFAGDAATLEAIDAEARAAGVAG